MNMFSTGRIRPLARMAGLVLATSAIPPSSWGQCPTPPGDINGDGATDVADVQCVVLSAIAALLSAPAPMCTAPGKPLDADIDCDGKATVADAMLSIAYSLGHPLNHVVDHDGDSCPDSCVPSKITLHRIATTGISANAALTVRPRGSSLTVTGTAAGSGFVLRPSFP